TTTRTDGSTLLSVVHRKSGENPWPVSSAVMKMRERAGFRLEDTDPELNGLLADIVDAAGVVRRELGAGLYEKIYERALALELTRRRHVVDVQVPQRATYGGEDLGLAFRADLLVDGRVLVELKAVDTLHPRHFSQALTYLRLSRMEAALLINFNEVPLGSGI